MQSVAALARSEMQTEARIEVVAEGGGAQRSLLSGGSVLHRHEQRQPQIETVARLLSGGVAGAVSKTCTAPLARLTILLQVRPGCALRLSSRQSSSLYISCYPSQSWLVRASVLLKLDYSLASSLW